MHLFYQPESVPYLPEDESRHAVKTLRLGAGDSLAVTDGRGNLHKCQLVQPDPHRCTYRVLATEHKPQRPFWIRVCVAPTKNTDRIEWFVEKAVEIGIERISFFYGRHSERRHFKTDRIQKIAIAAMKQSLQTWLPILDEPLPFAQLVESVDEPEKFLAHLPDNDVPLHIADLAAFGSRYAVLVGPEGDFSDTEIRLALQAGFRIATLGTTRLRTETAALTACQILTMLNR